jgi:hypothetical protein
MRRNIFENCLESAGQNCVWKQDHYSPVELFDILGPCARTCLFPRRKSGKGLKADFFDFNKIGPDLDPNKFISMLKTCHVPDTHEGATFQRFFYGSNAYLDQPNPVFKPRLSYDVPTRFLRSLVVDEFRRLKHDARMKLAEELAPYPQVACVFYEALVVDTLVSLTESVDCHLYDGSQSFQLGPGLHTYMDVISDSEVDFTPETNRLYVPPTGFPFRDAFIIIKDGNRWKVIFLQLTMAHDHALKAKGIYKIMNLFPASEREQIDWFFIFVTPDGNSQKIARNRINDLKWFQIDGVSIEVKIGWMVVSNADESTNTVLVSTCPR